MSAFTIRRIETMSPEQNRQLSEVLLGVVEAGASVGFLPPLSPVDAERYWSEVFKPGVVLLIAEHDGRIIGAGQLELAMRAHGRNRAEVCKVLVHPDAQGQGIGKAMMQALEREALHAGRKLLHLDTQAGDRSNRFYQRLGYTEGCTIPGWSVDRDGTLHGTTFYYKELSDGD